MKVKVLCLGRAAKEVTLEDGATVEQAIAESGFPKDSAYNRHVNGNHAMDSDTVQDGDVVTLLSAISGG